MHCGPDAEPQRAQVSIAASRATTEEGVPSAIRPAVREKRGGADAATTSVPVPTRTPHER